MVPSSIDHRVLERYHKMLELALPVDHLSSEHGVPFDQLSE